MLLHSTAQHSTAQHSTAQHSTAQHSTAQHSTAQHSTAQHSTAQHSTAQHSTAQHSTAQHSTAQHSTAQRGFSVVGVMVVAVSLGILALVFNQTAINKLKLNNLAAAINYRQAVLNYYYHIAANRHSYECTKLNESNLQNYVDGVSISLSKQALDVYNVTSPCTVLIPSAGVGLNVDDDFPVANPLSSTCTNKQICLKSEVVGIGGGEVEMILTISFSSQGALNIAGMETKDEERSLFFNQTVQKNCSTSSGERAAIGAVFAISTDNPNLGVTCSTETLVEPPRSGSADVALCPTTAAGGRTGVVRFDAATGLTICSTSHILLKTPIPTGNAATGASNAGHVKTTILFDGVTPQSCGRYQALTSTSGGCVRITPPGPTGDRGGSTVPCRRYWYHAICKFGGARCNLDGECPDKTCDKVCLADKERCINDNSVKCTQNSDCGNREPCSVGTCHPSGDSCTCSGGGGKYDSCSASYSSCNTCNIGCMRYEDRCTGTDVECTNNDDCKNTCSGRVNCINTNLDCYSL